MQFEFEGETGVVKDRVTGERCIIITQARIQEIFSRLSDIFQTDAKVIFFEAGKAAGERFVEDRPEIMKTNKKVFIETAVQRFTDAGLGKIEIVEFDPRKQKPGSESGTTFSPNSAVKNRRTATA